jgi:ubiquinone/menaquinone biosynthesis C-methylase UbiE
MHAMDVAAFKERQRRIWSLGDYSQLSRILEPAAVALCDACAVSAGQEVLDVAAGDGNFALACAREGASVVASDISPGMVERGRKRSAAEGYEIDWVEADVEELPFDDARFDCVGSVFGAMIAPRPELVARELFRVVRPGGTVGMTAWWPDTFMTELQAVGRAYAPPQPGLPVSEQWAVEETVRGRFAGLAARIELERRSLEWRAESPEALVGEVSAPTPTMVAARQALPPERYDALVGELVEVARRHGGDGPLLIENDYALIVARRRG